MLELTVLAVPGCPNGPLMEERVEQALAGRPDVTVTRKVISDQEEAERAGMRGSPTLLIDGVDPFAAPDVPFSVSCRLFRGEDGSLDGAPSVPALRRALDEASRPFT
ncbi:thioredoxin family protein [Nonomuraea sp. NPDC005983]|uniref:thioredoxin family protein n=1 Tax=Nonomuraea sp. NPDC005983 TaxID=3155595 RepID=UPI0033A7D015